MILVTTAAGEKHRAFALALRESLIRWGWPPIIIASDEPLGVPQNVVREDDFGRGRGLKTRWAGFLPPEYRGACAFVDCDCEARGPWVDPCLAPDEVAAITAGKVHAKKPFHFVHSGWVGCGSADLAREVCADWSDRFARQPNASSDEQDLTQALRSHPYRVVPSTYDWPLPNLWHIGATSGEGQRARR